MRREVALRSWHECGCVGHTATRSRESSIQRCRGCRHPLPNTKVTPSFEFVTFSAAGYRTALLVSGAFWLLMKVRAGRLQGFTALFPVILK